MSPEIFNEMQTETSGEFGGLGIEGTIYLELPKLTQLVLVEALSRAN